MSSAPPHTGTKSGLEQSAENAGISDLDPLLPHPDRPEEASDQCCTRDDSVITVDEYTPDISEVGLNSQVLTTRPLQLRQ